MIVTPNQGTANLFTGGDVLYVFAPTRLMPIGPVAHRPLLYRVTEDFAMQAASAVDTSFTSRNPVALRNLLNSKTAHEIILPQANVENVINLTPMAERWRGVLILNNPTPVGLAVPTSRLTSNRVIIMGWFDQEPLNPLTMFTSPTVNPNAHFIVSHKTVVESMGTASPHGMTYNRINTRVDQQIVQPNLVASMSTDPNLCFCDPASLYGVRSYTPEGTAFRAPTELANGLLASTAGAPVALAANLQNPQVNLYKTLNAVVDGYRDVMKETTSGQYGGGGYGAQLPGIAADSLSDAISANLSSTPHPSAILGPNTNEVLPIMVLLQRYHPEITPIVPEQSSMYSTADQIPATPVNVFSELLCSVVPTVMAQMGLATLSFSFQSYHEGLATSLSDPNATPIQIHHYETMVPMPTDMAVMRVDAVIDDLRKGVFSTIKSQHGDFYVDMQVNTAGMAQCQLSFMSDAHTTMTPFEKPVCYDGLITNLLGSNKTCDHNASQISHLMNAINSDYGTGAKSGGLHVELPPVGMTGGHGGVVNLGQMTAQSGPAPAAPAYGAQPQPQPNNGGSVRLF